MATKSFLKNVHIKEHRMVAGFVSALENAEMSGISVILLRDLIEEMGEDFARSTLSSFLSPKNPDVENFLHRNAIEFCNRGFATQVSGWR